MKVEQPKYNKNVYIIMQLIEILIESVLTYINWFIKISKTGKTCLNIGEPSSKAKYDI